MVNITQLEKIRQKISEIDDILDEDTTGVSSIQCALTDLESTVIEKLQSLVWQKYEEEREKQ